jgi:plasmid stabilization system protein ParE
MDCKINWTLRAWKTYEEHLSYLESVWTQKEISSFILSVDNKVINLSKHPRIGSSRNQKYPNIRYTLIHKRVTLISQYKPRKNEMDLLVFWHTAQNPKQLKVR